MDRSILKETALDPYSNQSALINKWKKLDQQFSNVLIQILRNAEKQELNQIWLSQVPL